jgi:hypothetical protein
MPTSAAQRKAMREAGAYQHDLQPVKNIWEGRKKVNFAPSILDGLDEAKREELDQAELNDAMVAYFDRIAGMTPLQVWQDAHDWIIEKGDSLEICDKSDWDVYPCIVNMVKDGQVWIQRDDRRNPEIADLTLLQTITDDEDDGEEY